MSNQGPYRDSESPKTQTIEERFPRGRKVTNWRKCHCCPGTISSAERDSLVFSDGREMVMVDVCPDCRDEYCGCHSCKLCKKSVSWKIELKISKLFCIVKEKEKERDDICSSWTQREPFCINQ
jgi:hypothetical protein